MNAELKRRINEFIRSVPLPSFAEMKAAMIAEMGQDGYDALIRKLAESPCEKEAEPDAAPSREQCVSVGRRLVEISNEIRRTTLLEAAEMVKGGMPKPDGLGTFSESDGWHSDDKVAYDVCERIIEKLEGMAAKEEAT